MPPTYQTIVNTHKASKITAILIGVLVSIPLLFFGFLAVQQLSSRASDSTPTDVLVGSITQTTAKISWTTDQETQSIIEYGTSPTALTSYAPEAEKTRLHDVELTLLTPSTTHYFQIHQAENIYDNGGIPWTFTTKGKDATATPTAAIVPTSIAPTLSISMLPTQVPTKGVLLPTSSPTPIPTAAVLSCNETNCQKILQQLGKGCTVANYLQCIKLTPTASASATPTFTPTPTPH